MPDGDPGPLNGRRVLVVGAATGIGRATAVKVAEDGAQVAMMDIIPAGDAPIVSDVATLDADTQYWQVDIRNENEIAAGVESVAAWMGGIDVLLHVAGIQAGSGVDVTEFEADVWDNLMAVNLRGAFLVVKHVLPELEKSAGALVLTSSGAGIFGGSGSYAYGASKGGVHGLALTLEKHLEGRNVRVNEVAPGWIDTPLLRREVGDVAADGAGSADGVAEVMAFLASPRADYVRGIVRTR